MQSRTSPGGSRQSIMSHTDLSFAFAQARLQARFGARPSVSDWNHIEATADLAATLQVVRNTTLARWTARLGAHAGRPRHRSAPAG